MGNPGLLKCLNYTVLQLDQFCIKQEKWVKMPYMLLFISLQDMTDLCPKGTDLGVKSSALPVLVCPCTRGSKLSKLEVREPPTRRVALVSVKMQTEIQTAQVEVQTTPSQYDLRLLWFQ